jgi:glycosyltransferase involved in cell wall biosynthesis
MPMDLTDRDVLISVVVPLYNKEASIDRTIQSVLNQTFSNYEIIVVNDGSTDDSLAVLKKINDARIRIIDKPNGGVSHARNTGIRAAKGLYVAFLDADDIWLPEYLREIKIVIDEFKDCNIFGTDYTISTLPVATQDRDSVSHEIISTYFELTMYMPFLHISAVVVKKECFKNEMFFNEKLTHGEDLDLWSRLFNKFGYIGYSNRKLVHYDHSAMNRACRTIPKPQKHFAFYFKLNEAGSAVEKKYYLYQISSLALLYLKTSKINYLFEILLKYKRFIPQIVFVLFTGIIFTHKYKRAFKGK